MKNTMWRWKKKGAILAVMLAILVLALPLWPVPGAPAVNAEIVDICDRAAKIPLRERLREKKRRREIRMDDCKQAISEKKTVLPSWYFRAQKEIEGSGEADMFQDLIQAARNY